MPQPSLFPGAVPFIPGSNDPTVVASQNGSSGGSVGGLVVSQVQGVCIAFTSPTMTDSPLWTRIDDPNGPFIVTGYTVDRGRSYELDQTQPGTASVTVIDVNGYFDPTNPLGPFYGDLVPLKKAAIALRNPVTGNWRTIFDGFVSRWSFDMYQTENFNTVTIEMVDGMEVLSAAEMQFNSFLGSVWGDPIPAGSEGNIFYAADDHVAHRINHILNDAGWPNGLREVFSGNVSLQKTVYAPRSSALTAIQDAADADFPGVANVYIGAGPQAGKLVFHGRQARFHPEDANYHISSWLCGDITAVGLNPSNTALIFGLEWDIDKDKIINEALVTPQNVNDADIELNYVSDGASMAQYGVRGISFENLLTNQGHLTGNVALDETRLYGQYYVDNYAQPRTRINSIKLRSLGANDPYAAQVYRLMCNVDISDLVTVTTYHGGGGGFGETFYVEGLHYTVGPMSGNVLDVELTIDLSPQAYYSTPIS